MGPTLGIYVHSSFNNDEFKVTTKNNQNFTASIVIGAYGKRAALDAKMDRGFMKKKSPFLAVKTHVKGNFPNDLVALHNFEGNGLTVEHKIIQTTGISFS